MKKITNLTPWILFGITFFVYLLCLPETITFWDSPEFVSSNYKLQTTHPAGAPFYTMLCNVLTGLFFFFKPAFVSNLFSAFFGALTIPLIFKITVHFASKINNVIPYNISLVAGIVASLSFAFCHSFWTASTETEVYTLSFFLLTLIVWLSLLWENSKTLQKEIRLVLLIFLLLGISVGVHLINIAVIIPLSLIYTHKKYGLNIKNICISLFVGLFLFIFLLNVLFQGILSFCSSADIWLVNSYDFSVNYGALLAFIFIILLLIAIIYISYVKKKFIVHTIVLASFMFCSGTSSYIMVLIRSQIITPTSTQTLTCIALLSYIKAEQFGVHKIPLFKGTSFNAPLDQEKPFVDQKPSYSYNAKQKKYIVNDGKLNQINYDKRFSLFFPRVFHKNQINSNGYKTWATIKGSPINIKRNDQLTRINKPTFYENLSFFYNYQVNWLYLRYLFQNFIGMQNSLKGTGDITQGNWSSGFSFIDKNIVGFSKKTPEYYKDLNSNDIFYGIPFLMGLWGLFILRKHKAYFYTSILLFLLFGLGIIVYVNPVPQSILIRERDYIFAASFIFFSIWIGLSVIGIYSLLFKIKKQKIRIGLTFIIGFIASPLQLFSKGFDNHNRKDDHFAYQLAKSYLDACPPQAILITNTDNFTFPLWYLQEVENYRTDIRVINYDQLAFDWYYNKLKVKLNNSAPLDYSLSKNFSSLKFDTQLPFNKITSKFLNIKKLSDFIDNPKNRIPWFHKKIHFFPTENLLLPIGNFERIKNEAKLLDRRVIQLDTIKWNHKKNLYSKNDIILLDIIANNFDERAICFAEIGNTNHTLGLQNFLIQKGLIKQLLPFLSYDNNNPKIVSTSVTKDILVKNSSFLSLDNKQTKVTDENITITKTVLRRSFYFLAQALLEENKPNKAIEVLNYAINTFPNTTVPFEEYAFAIGKLYHRLHKEKVAKQILITSIKNIKKKINWIVSIDSPRPIINVRRANSLMNKYVEMIHQIKNINPNLHQKESKDLVLLQKQLETWKQRNWPY